MLASRPHDLNQSGQNPLRQLSHRQSALQSFPRSYLPENRIAKMSNPPLQNQPPGTPPDGDVVADVFRHLCEVIARLRSPEGCPWDRQQTLASIKPYTLEETYELLEAIDADDTAGIQEELGDVSAAGGAGRADCR